MANVIEFDMKGVPQGLTEMYVKVTDTNRNEIYSGVIPVINRIALGDIGELGQEVLVYADSFDGSNALSFKGMCGGSVIKIDESLITYNNVVFLGASIISGAFGTDLTTPNTSATEAFKALGSNVDVYGYGFHSSTADVVAEKLQEAMAAFPEKTLFVIHGSGNDASRARPYADATQADLDEVTEHYQALMDVVATRPDDCLVACSTFRSYSDDPNSTLLFNDEAQGSKPFNENILIPMIANVLPESINSDGYPTVDVYNFTRNNYKWMLRDGVHMTGDGNIAFRQFMAERTAYKIQDLAKPQPVERIDSTTIQFGSDIDGLGINNIGNSEFNNGLPITLFKDYDASESISLLITSTLEGGVNGNGGDTGNDVYYGDLTYAPFTLTSITVDAAATVTLDFSQLEPNADYECSFVGSRTSGAERITRYTSQGKTADVYTSPTVPNAPVSMVLESDGSGNITVVATCAEGTNMYLGGIQIKRV